MFRYAVARLLGAIPTLFALVTIAFFLVRLAPGGPFDEERQLPPEIEANLRRAYNLDAPLKAQYLRYLGDLARGDLGPSFKYKDYRVAELIATGLPVTARIGLSALVVAVVIGVACGAVAALRRNGWVDRLVMTLAMTGIAIPNFVVAPALTLLLGVYLRILPVGGWGDGALRYLVLPVVALALPKIAYVARLTRGSLAEVLGSPYIRTARAKGLRNGTILARHAARAALLPVVSYLGPTAAALLTGSVVIEQIFGIPGLGRYFVQGALNRDYTLVLGIVLFYGSLIILLNLLADLAYGWLDPRVRYD